jgi:hypothetical protein
VFEQVVRHRPGLVEHFDERERLRALELVAQEVRDARGTPPATFSGVMPPYLLSRARRGSNSCWLPSMAQVAGRLVLPALRHR